MVNKNLIIARKLVVIAEELMKEDSATAIIPQPPKSPTVKSPVGGPKPQTTQKMKEFLDKLAREDPSNIQKKYPSFYTELQKIGVIQEQDGVPVLV